MHHWTPPKGYERLLERSFAGGGVTVGDYDGDGLPDLYLTRPFGGGRLYRNTGGFRFEDATAVAGVENASHWGSGCAFADVNGDGALDLYVCGYDCPNLLFVNNGDGTFKEEAKARGLAVHGASVMSSFADYDNDGDLDLYLARNRFTPPDENGSYDWVPNNAQAFSKLMRTAAGPVVPEDLREYWDVLYFPERGKVRMIQAGQQNVLFENQGDGTFVDVTEKARLVNNGMTLSATWLDYNHDRLPDLFVANDFFGADCLYRNNGDGTFTDVVKTVLPHVPWFSMGSDIADINNDGLIDFIASDMSGSTHYKQKIGMGDMSDSGWFLDSSDPPQYMRNAVYVNTGRDRFLEVAHMTGLANTDWTWSIKMADLDCDGWCDVYVTNGMTGDWLNTDIRNKYGAGFDTLVKHVGRKNDPNFAFKNQGELRFTDNGDDWGLSSTGVSFGAGYGDFDRDGDLDLVVNNFDEAPSIYRNDAATGNSIAVRLVGEQSNSHGVGAMISVEADGFKQSKYVTLARGFMSTDESVAHFGLGQIEQIAKVTIHWPSGVRQELASLEANHLYTITERKHTSDSEATPPDPEPLLAQSKFEGPEHIEREYDDFADQPLLPNRLSTLGPGIAFGDINNDGADEVFLGGAAGQASRLFAVEQSELGPRFRDLSLSCFTLDAECEDMGAIFFDANGDGHTDLYVVSGGNEARGEELLRDRLYLNNGDGDLALAEGAVPSPAFSGSSVTAADYDRDGDLDLFVGGRLVGGSYPVAPRSAIYRNDSANGEVVLKDVTDAVAPDLAQAGMVTSALWSDADGDGWIDLLLSTEWGPIRYLKNKAGSFTELTEEANLADRTGWWNSLSAGDIDRDGDTDYLVTNFGLNTKYHPTPKKPSVLFYGDFDESGRARIIEAKMSSEGLLPVRGKSCSQNAMPFIRNKLPTYDAFAKSLLPDIYTETCLDEALQVQANELRHGVLINNGDAQFSFTPLPRIAQASPSLGSSLVDLNGDGNLDIVLGQNFFGPQRETGRMDGGVGAVLLGDGNGAFTAMPARESGFVAPWDARGVVAGAFDQGRVGVFVVTNNGPLRYFSQPKDAAQACVARLSGPDGNPTAVGARVLVETNDARTIACETRAGGGYLSQGPSGLLLPIDDPSSIARISVRWPDGKESSHAPPYSRRMTLQWPGPPSPRTGG